MANLVRTEFQPDQGSLWLKGVPSHRRRIIRLLFVHRDIDAIDSCLQELENGQFTVIHDIVLNLGQCAQQLQSQSYDVILVEYPSPGCKDLQALQHFRKTTEDLPLIFLTTGVVGESITELTVQGVFDSVEQEHIARLPMTVRRALNDKKLREELEEARKALKHSQSLYRALVDNPAYGIYRCNAEGELLDVNQALVTMLGYTSKEQVLAANQGSAMIPNLCTALPFVWRAPEATRIEPVEMGWKRKDGTTLKARLSGRGVYDELGNFAGREADTIGTLLYAADVAPYAMKNERPRAARGSGSFSTDSNPEFLSKLEVIGTRK